MSNENIDVKFNENIHNDLKENVEITKNKNEVIDEDEKLKKINKKRKRLNIVQPIAMILFLVFFIAWLGQSLALSFESDDYNVVWHVFYGVGSALLAVISLICMVKRLVNTSAKKNVFMLLNIFAIVCLLIAEKSFVGNILVVLFIICFFYQWRMEKRRNKN